MPDLLRAKYTWIRQSITLPVQNRILLYYIKTLG